MYRKYLGGRGLALPYMLREMPAQADPLGPDNILVFAPGLLTGAPGPAMPRIVVCGKSPLTGAFGESEAGGWWGPELKKAGFDALTIRGKATEPMYLWIKDGQVEFRTAHHLWGQETQIVQKRIREELQDTSIRVIQTGPAGERMVRYANIVNELAHFNGRNGLGAVMGSKNLRAIAVRGTQERKVADPDTIKAISGWTAREGLEKPQGATLRKQGTLALIRPFHVAGVLPTQNWNKGTFHGVDTISSEYFHEHVLISPKSCYACPIRCKRRAKVDREDMQVDPIYGGPEYETVASLGSILEIPDPYLIAKANELCNKYCLDTISVGMTIGFAMECYEEGLLSKEDCDGLELTFGNGEVLLPLIEKIVNREGIGDLLAEGSRRASRNIKGSEQYLVEVKGQEVPMHDPRGKTGVALQYALADYGADHKKGPHDTLFANNEAVGVLECKGLGILEPIDPIELGPKKVRFFVLMDLFWSLLDGLGLCTFGFSPRGPIPLDTMEDLVKAVTGWDSTLWEMMKASERTINMARLFNLREGFSREDDRLPEKFFRQFSDGPNAGRGGIDREELDRAITLRYEMMGWDTETTRPLAAKLHELDLAFLLDEDGDYTGG